MRILVISSTVFKIPLSNYGGLEQIAYQCAEGLKAKGHEVTLVAPKGSKTNCDLYGTPFRCGEDEAYNGYKDLLKKYDVIVDHSWSKQSVLWKMQTNAKTSILLVCHAPIQTMYSTPPSYAKPCLVGISEDHTQSIRDHLHVDARCCYNGIDLDFYKPTNVPRNNRYLFLSRFSSIKGPDIAAEVCLRQRKGLDLIGDTSITNEPELLTRVRSLASSSPELLTLVGGQTREQCRGWFNSNRCLLHPIKTFREPYGLSVVESQACGMPVIAFANGSMSEVIKPGETGYLVTNEGAMEMLLDADADRNLSSTRCREWAFQFSLQRMVDRYEELCQEAISGGW